jgi:hypothetical protein
MLSEALGQSQPLRVLNDLDTLRDSTSLRGRFIRLRGN